jgi:hypothetical protein
VSEFGSDAWAENQHHDGWNDLDVINEPDDDEYEPLAKSATPAMRNKVGERDDWICHRCNKPISRDREWPHPLAAVADHYPITRNAGGRTVMANLRIAHTVCNSPVINDGLTGRLYANPATATYPYTEFEISVMDHIREMRTP